MLVHDRGILLKNITSFEDQKTDQLDRLIQYSIPIVKQRKKNTMHYGKQFKSIPYYFIPKKTFPRTRFTKYIIYNNKTNIKTKIKILTEKLGLLKPIKTKKTV